MRKLAALLFFVLPAAIPLVAQKRVEVGVFVDYLNISQTSTSNFGLGGRFGYRMHRNIMLEGELAYDYGTNFDEVYRNISNGNLSAIERTSIGVTHGLFGPCSNPLRVTCVPSPPSKPDSWISA